MKKFAVMAVDPGGVTGVAWGRFNGARALTLRQLLARAVEREAVRSAQLTGPSSKQAVELMTSWANFRYEWNVELGQPLDSCFVVFESFELRQLNADLSPVKVMGGFEALTGVHCTPPVLGPIAYQTPSDAKSFVTNERLRSWGLWKRGEVHSRDALRHMALMASRLLDE